MKKKKLKTKGFNGSKSIATPNAIHEKRDPNINNGTSETKKKEKKKKRSIKRENKFHSKTDKKASTWVDNFYPKYPKQIQGLRHLFFEYQPKI